MKNRLVIGSLVSLFLVLSFTESTAQENGMIKDGNRSYDKKNYKEAERSYNSALGKYPDSYKANFNMGDALYKQKRYKEAGGYFNRAAGLAKQREDGAKSYYNLGNSYMAQNDLDESIKAYKNALKLNPDDVYSKYNLSYALGKKKQQQRQQQMAGNNPANNQKSDNKDNGNNPGKRPQVPGQKPEYNNTPSGGNNISESEAERILDAINANEQRIRQRIYDNNNREQRYKTDKPW